MLLDLADIGPIHVDGAFRDFIETRDKIDNRRFSRTGSTNQGSGLPGLGSKADIMQYIFLCTRIAKRHVTEFDRPSKWLAELSRFLWVFDAWFGFQDISDTITRYSCSWQHDKHHCEHEEGKKDLHGVLHKSHHVANLYIRLGDLMGTDPEDQQSHDVHDQHHQRHHDNHDPVDEQEITGHILVGFIEARFLEGLHIEGPDNHHAGKVFTHNQVEPVE